MPAKEKPQSRSLLQKKFETAEARLKELAGKTDDASTRERRKLKTLLKRLGTQLGTMNPPDKEYP